MTISLFGADFEAYQWIMSSRKMIWNAGFTSSDHLVTASATLHMAGINDPPFRIIEPNNVSILRVIRKGMVFLSKNPDEVYANLKSVAKIRAHLIFIENFWGERSVTLNSKQSNELAANKLAAAFLESKKIENKGRHTDYFIWVLLALSMRKKFWRIN